MKTPRVRERIVAEGVWTAASALHTGGDATLEHNVDMALLRSASGFLVPGSSVAGAARSYLARRTQSDPEFRTGQESAALQSLFGGRLQRKGNQAVYASLLSISDARQVGPGVALVRDCVRIDDVTGIAADEAKFNLEVLPAGSSFALRLELVVYEDTPEETLGALRMVLEGFASGEIRLGARTRKGLGVGRVALWQVRRLMMNDAVAVRAWLARELSAVPVVSVESLGPASESQREWLEIEAAFHLKTSLLIRAGSEDPRLPDMTHLTEAGQALLSGSSLLGALRHRVGKIAETLGIPRETETRMFGPIHGERGKGKGLYAGRVWVREAAVEQAALAVQSRVALDRFTGGALETALFDEAPCWPKRGGGVNLRLQIGLELRADEWDQAAGALLLAAFKDLWLADLPLGGEVGVGRGVLEGLTATIRRTGWPEVKLEGSHLTGWTAQWATWTALEVRA